mgnify:CR=1 FL=1|tara:strand:- start:1094 stop:2251 length:1158 start_codon:yes stop_codon:yes gene_type:complete
MDPKELAALLNEMHEQVELAKKYYSQRQEDMDEEYGLIDQEIEARTGGEYSNLDELRAALPQVDPTSAEHPGIARAVGDTEDREASIGPAPTGLGRVGSWLRKEDDKFTIGDIVRAPFQMFVDRDLRREVANSITSAGQNPILPIGDEVMGLVSAVNPFDDKGYSEGKRQNLERATAHRLIDPQAALQAKTAGAGAALYSGGGVGRAALKYGGQGIRAARASKQGQQFLSKFKGSGGTAVRPRLRDVNTGRYTTRDYPRVQNQGPVLRYDRAGNARMVNPENIPHPGFRAGPRSGVAKMVYPVNWSPLTQNLTGLSLAGGAVSQYDPFADDAPQSPAEAAQRRITRTLTQGALGLGGAQALKGGAWAYQNIPYLFKRWMLRSSNI